MDWCGGIGCDRRWRQTDRRFPYCCILRMDSEQWTMHGGCFFFPIIRTVGVFFLNSDKFFLDQTGSRV
jgi:hypothetical protein